MVGGDVDFFTQGRAFFDYLVNHSRVSPQASVLDIGCGLGKHAVHFATYLEDTGCYEGFDVEPLRIRWCQRAITSRHSNVRFRYSPVHNAMYSPGAGAEAAYFTFPYDDASFDLVFLGSVFTHMFEADVARYASEIARMLKPQGMCIATFYLMTPARRQAILAGPAAFTFNFSHKGSWIETLQSPEAAVAHEQAGLFEMFAAAGLTPAAPIRYGAWDQSLDQDQDFVTFAAA